ncbi:hypothetical protein RF11_01541 [Thelohanellus kitauei]|uniref:Uncharacterized protein n=1 Tax=Thelohanellus kitauei TaxID=669202 RepID=A0A0C2MP14_THEKT|nr:hypothetical protein RF11_01541 [Thelohanellus kitauei]
MLSKKLDVVIAIFLEPTQFCHKLLCPFPAAICCELAGQINSAIEFCMKFGYLCHHKLNDVTTYHILITKADELRIAYHISHTCAITDINLNKYKGNKKKMIEDRSKKPLQLNSSILSVKASIVFLLRCLELLKPAAVHYYRDFTSTAIAMVSSLIGTHLHTDSGTAIIKLAKESLHSLCPLGIRFKSGIC